MDLMYYVTKWPFVVVFAYAFIHRALGARVIRLGGRAWPLATVVAWALTCIPLYLTVALLS
jgi:hypothetical protein